MLKVKTEFKKGDKVIVFGVESGVSFDYWVGEVLDDMDNNSKTIPIQFEKYNKNFHSCNGLGENGYCYFIRNTLSTETSDKYKHSIALYEYDKEELKLAKKKFKDRANTSIISSYISYTCSRNSCSNCPLNPINISCSCCDVEIKHSSDMLYNSFMNTAYEYINKNK